jgi:hypothetical protein
MKDIAEIEEEEKLADPVREAPLPELSLTVENEKVI